MSLEIIVGGLASVTAGILASVIKKLVTRYVDRKAVFKSQSGKIKEIEVDKYESNIEVQNVLINALDYENTVIKAFDRQGMEVVFPPQQSQVSSFDFIANDGTKKYYVEAKTNKEPLGKSYVHKLGQYITDPSSGGIIVSQSGFTQAAISEVENKNKGKIFLVSGDNPEKLDQDISNVIKSNPSITNVSS